MEQFKRVWRDPVWSQVIAGLIIAWITALAANYTNVIYSLLTFISIFAIAGTIGYQWVIYKNSGFTLDANGYYIGLGILCLLTPPPNPSASKEHIKERTRNNVRSYFS